MGVHQGAEPSGGQLEVMELLGEGAVSTVGLLYGVTGGESSEYRGGYCMDRLGEGAATTVVCLRGAARRHHFVYSVLIPLCITLTTRNPCCCTTSSVPVRQSVPRPMARFPRGRQTDGLPASHEQLRKAREEGHHGGGLVELALAPKHRPGPVT